jgi:tRNA(Glu) U13 pseudouridine synthase TruD
VKSERYKLAVHAILKGIGTWVFKAEFRLITKRINRNYAIASCSVEDYFGKSRFGILRRNKLAIKIYFLL